MRGDEGSCYFRPLLSAADLLGEGAPIVPRALRVRVRKDMKR